MTDEPWVRVARDALFGQWHIRAGDGSGYVLTACDMRLREKLVERKVEEIPLRQRCPVCQDQYELTPVR